MAHELNHGPIIKKFVDAANLSEADKGQLAKATTISELVSAVKAAPDRSDALTSLHNDLSQAFPNGTLTAKVNSILTELLPTFLLFSDYFRLPGRASLDRIASKKANGTLDREDKVFLSLLDLARSSLEEVQQTGTIEELNI